MSSSEIDPTLLAAYRETLFEVHEPASFTLRIGKPCAELQALHTRHGVTASVFITAYNPRSEQLTDADNAARHATLCDELSRSGRVFFRGQGRHSTNDWPPELSLLVLGLDLTEAREVGARWGQNAIVWSGLDAVPALIVTANQVEEDR